MAWLTQTIWWLLDFFVVHSVPASRNSYNKDHNFAFGRGILLTYVPKVNNTVEGIKMYQKKWLDHLRRMDKIRLQRMALQYQPRDGGIWEDQDEDGETTNTLSFKGTSP
jgi:hypothetical protein